MRIDASCEGCEKTKFMKRNFIFCVCFLFLSFLNLQAQDSTRTGLLYGQNHSYYLTAPIGWVMDKNTAREEGMTAVFYPTGSSWADAETVMYAAYLNFDTAKKETVKEVIAADSIEFKKTSPELRIKKQSSIQAGKNKRAVVYSFSAPGNYETVAYLPEKKGVILLVISSKNKNGCINNYQSFESLVKSYRFLTDKVNFH
jgi:hypothetical protein